jgi:hypothetical protein
MAHHDDELSSSAERAQPPADGTGEIFPYESVVGVLDDVQTVNDTVEDLAASGFPENEIFVLAGERGVAAIDQKGKRHGLLGRIFRKLDTLGEEHEETQVHVDALRDGRFVVGAHVKGNGLKDRAVEVFQRHNGHHVSYYSRWTTERVVP